MTEKKQPVGHLLDDDDYMGGVLEGVVAGAAVGGLYMFLSKWFQPTQQTEKKYKTIFNVCTPLPPQYMHVNEETAGFFHFFLPYRAHSPVHYDKMIQAVNQILYLGTLSTISLERLTSAEQHAYDFLTASKQFQTDLKSHLTDDTYSKMRRKFKRFTRHLYNEQLRVIHGKCIQEHKQQHPLPNPSYSYTADVPPDIPTNQEPLVTPLPSSLPSSSTSASTGSNDFPPIQSRFAFPPLPTLPSLPSLSSVPSVPSVSNDIKRLE